MAEQKHNKFHYSLIILFCCFLSLPVLENIFNFCPSPEFYENRTLVSLPQFKISFGSFNKYLQSFDSFFNDNFGFRKNLIILNSVFIFKILHVSPSSKVILGKNGWLFFSGEDEKYAKFQPPLSQKEVENLFQKIKDKQKYFEGKGVKYLALVAPDKQSIYPEYLTDPYSTWAKISPYNQLSDFIKDHNGEDFFLDVKAAILKEKSKGSLVYYKTDSHWNNVSAFIVYSELLSHMKQYYPALISLQLHDFKRTVRYYSGDLIKFFLHLEPYLGEENIFYDYSKPFFATQTTFEKEYNGQSLIYPLLLSENKNVDTKTVVVLRDSQFIPILPWFAECFSKVLFINHWEKKETILQIINSERPFMVIDERVERSLMSHLID